MIRTSVQDITITPGGLVMGVIYFQIGNHAFPETGWTDLLLAVLDGWLHSMVRLRRRGVKQDSLYFMDGPFRVDICRTTDSLELQFCHGHSSGDEIVAKCVITWERLAIELLTVCRDVSRHCRIHGIANRDTLSVDRWSSMLTRSLGQAAGQT